MKKQYYFLAISALAAIVVMPAIIMAQMRDTASSSKSSLRAIPAKIRQEIRTDIEERRGNADINQNLRNNMLGTKASTTNMYRGALRTTMMSNMFEIRKKIIVNELEKALGNLNNVRGRIASRINKIASSTASRTRDMSNAKRLLVVADAKIVEARNAVENIKNLSATSTMMATSSISTSTASIDLKQPRLMATGAQNSIKEAKKALNDVVVEIAHAMGVRLDDDRAATSTSPSIR